MSAADDILKDLSERIARTLESFRGDLQSIRTGRANLHLLDSVRVDYYGQMTRWPMPVCSR
jgi:ribosome recycling factor